MTGLVERLLAHLAGAVGAFVGCHLRGRLRRGYRPTTVEP
ncbi:hypothetical protein BJ958_003416 [Nocardioides kongjuensis]|uniref:Uncharacterized protein n=1 Tax=Nocardioides kongjuensis TaxID=349522 RepID=A0A852RSL9_9ACTN|nr:hypothetical protein [Nocardioides kongjuensis]